MHLLVKKNLTLEVYWCSCTYHNEDCHMNDRNLSLIVTQ